jgi:hypothetical protein
VGHPVWYNWTPIFNGTGGMTFTSITDVIARFTIIGGTCIGHLEAQGTIGGTPSSSIEVTSPTPIAYMGIFPADGNAEGPWGWNLRVIKSTAAKILIQTSSYGNWTAGSGRWIRTAFNYVL